MAGRATGDGGKIVVRVERMRSELRGDFQRLHAGQWCHCVAWWVPTWDGWDRRTEDENRAMRDGLFDEGQYDGYLLYVDDAPAGWCQCGPRDRLGKLCSQYGLEPDPETWAVTCFMLAPEARGQGLCHRLLAAVLDDLEARGARHVQGFPRRGGSGDAGDEWTGPESLFVRAGFQVEREGSRGAIYGLRLPR